VCARFEVAVALPRRVASASAIVMGSLAVAAAVAMACALAVAGVLAWRPELSRYGLAWLPLYVLLGGVVQVLSNWAARMQDFRRLALSRVLQASVTAALSIGGALAAGAVPLVLVVATVAGQLFALALLAPGLAASGFGWRVPRRRIGRLLRHFRPLAAYNGPHVLSDAAQTSGLPLLLASLFGPQAAAYYAFTSRLLKAPLGLVSGAISQVYYPRAASQRGDDARLREEALRILRVSSLVALALLPLLLLLPDALYAWAFGAAWAEVGGFVRALAPWVLSSFVAAPLSVLYLVKERFGLDFALSLGATLLAFALLGAAVLAGLGLQAAMWTVSLGMTAYIIGSTVFEFTVVIARPGAAAARGR
jgi:O-antigen/teichoic acid export membrane protein